MQSVVGEAPLLHGVHVGFDRAAHAACVLHEVVHEFGHFITAKLTGMRVDEFAVGFGPKIYQTTEGETQYSLRLIPLGGYNKIAGMDPDEEPTPDGFTSKPIFSRMLVILAGPIMNFILPVLLFFGIFAILLTPFVPSPRNRANLPPD